MPTSPQLKINNLWPKVDATIMETVQKNHSTSEKSQLKTLIAKGKEQGFLTYAQVKVKGLDHLVGGAPFAVQFHVVVATAKQFGPEHERLRWINKH